MLTENFQVSVQTHYKSCLIFVVLPMSHDLVNLINRIGSGPGNGIFTSRLWIGARGPLNPRASLLFLHMNLLHQMLPSVEDGRGGAAFAHLGLLLSHGPL